MKRILSKILITSLILSFGWGSGGFARSETGADSVTQSVPTSTSVVVTTQSLVAPGIVLTQSVSCAGFSSVTNNFIQASSGINLNQLADCFSISLADAPQLPSLAIAQPMPLPELSVSSGPAWSPDQVGQAKGQDSPPAIVVSLALAILFVGAGKAVKKATASARRIINLPSKLTLSELQVYRC